MIAHKKVPSGLTRRELDRGLRGPFIILLYFSEG
ncbi:hypothetical protein MTJW_03620 [Moorella thermoacetica]|nr:hypothetical protein MTJW_03620 [Moorella thermoacetica]